MASFVDDDEFEPEDPNRAKLESFYERKRLERAFGTSVVEGEGGKLYAKVLEEKKAKKYGASWADIAEGIESGQPEAKKKRKSKDDRKKRKKRKKQKKGKRKRDRGSSSDSDSSDESEHRPGRPNISRKERKRLLNEEVQRQQREEQEENLTAMANDLLLSKPGCASLACEAKGCPLKFLARNEVMAWEILNPVTGNVRRPQRIGQSRKPAHGSESEW